MTARPAPATSRGEAALPATLLATLVAATLVEFLLLRNATRVAIHIPGIEEVAGPYRGISAAGEYGYYVSAVAAVAWLGIAAVALWRRAERQGTLGAAAVGVFLVAAAGGRAGLVPQASVDIVTIGSVLTMAGVVAGRGSALTAAVLATYAVAFGTTASATVVSGTNGAGELLTIGEAAAVAFACMVPLAVGLRPTRGLLLAWVVCAVITFGGLAGASASSIRILMLWNGGLSGAFAPAWYAGAAAAVAVTFIGLARGGRWWVCAALALLVAGGFGLHSTHQSALVLAGLSALALAGVAKGEGTSAPVLAPFPDTFEGSPT